MKEAILMTLFQLILTWVMTGILWFTQIVHYPLYVKIKEGFIDYERAHMRRAALLIAPIMLAEAITAVWLISLFTEKILLRLAGANLIMLILIWLATFLFQITQHQKLSVRFSRRILAALITSNWIRTVLWTIKGVIVAMIGYASL